MKTKRLISNEKQEQNLDRLKGFIFHTLGCNKKDAEYLIKKFIKDLKKKKNEQNNN